jgi:hypothetical protein
MALGGPASFLGYPTTDETGTPDGVGRFNHFFNSGSIYWTPATNAWSIHGAIRAKWASMGWERSCLGYPVSDEFAISGGDRAISSAARSRGTPRRERPGRPARRTSLGRRPPPWPFRRRDLGWLVGTVA